MLNRVLHRGRRSGRRGAWRLSASSWRTAQLTLTLVLVLVVAGCGGDDDDSGAKIDWQVGTPRVDVAVDANPPAEPTTTPDDGDVADDGQPVETATGAVAETPTPVEPATVDTADVNAADGLSPEELAEARPNELGIVPILEYHAFTSDPEKEAQFTRPIQDFRDDLEWLYENNFYVIPLRDLFLDQINVPAGKHPVALTFDDSTVGQFRYLIADDGSVTIDPDSAVGAMEAFYAEHPDFGRGGWFGVVPGFCFDWETTGEAEDDQTEYCPQKLQWLMDNGYEVGNHTLNHQRLLDVDDETFKAEISGAIEAFQAMVPEIQADILAMPEGAYPDNGENERQMEMLENGFEYNGKEIKLLGCLMVGSEPAASPVSTEWDAVWTLRIQVFDKDSGDDNSSFWWWVPYFEDNPDVLYTSDGNPETITVPTTLPSILDGTLDRDKAEAGGKEIIEYDA